MNNSWVFNLCTFASLLLLQTKVAIACSVFPSSEKIEEHFRKMIDRADYVFVGTVHHIQRRRWNDDDEKPYFHGTWLEIAAKANAGEDVGRDSYIANWVNFAEATAFLEVDVELYWTGLKKPYTVAEVREFVPIDMLRPFTVFGRGPCFSFPQTCPWDIGRGSTVALAIKKTNFGPKKVLFCRKIPDFNSFDRERIRKSNRFVTKYEAIAPYFQNNARPILSD